METGTTLKHYRIVSLLGEGGMGAVYRAEDTRLGRDVALKVLRPDLTASAERLARFEREARAASAVSHPGVATLFDIHREGGTIFLAMEYVEGKTLRQLLHGGRLPLAQVIDCVAQVSDALSAAHRKGIIHRDLKPENVMASDAGFYKILDFGLARMALREDSSGGPIAQLTQVLTLSRNISSEGQVSGTLAYMSPEQIQGETVDARSDLFSLGVVLYELATGVSPFRGKNLIATFHAIVHEQPPSISSQRSDTPPELDRIVAKCLAKDPRERYQTAADLALDLRTLKRESDSGSWRQAARPAASTAQAASSGWVRAWVRNGAIAAGGVALILASFILYRPHVKSPDLARPVPAPPASPARPDRSRIAVTPFANRSGDASADWLGQGLPEMLTTDLARVPGLHMISSQRLADLLSAAGKGAVKDFDQGASTQLGRYAGAGVVVNGSIFKTEGGFRVDVQAYDTTTGHVLVAHRAEGRQIFKIADELGSALKKGLKVGAPQETEQQVIATSSPEAYRFFSQGMKLYQETKFQEASDLFRRSLKVDPDFTSSQLRLGMSLLLSGNREEGVRWIARASGQPEGLPEKEQILSEALQSAFGGPQSPKAPELLEELAERYPHDPECLFWQAEVRSSNGGNRFEAIRILHQAVDQDPNDALSVTALARHLKEMGLERDADAILADFQRRTAHSSSVLPAPGEAAPRP